MTKKGMTNKKQIIIGSALALLIVLALGIYKFIQISAAIAEGKKKGPPPTFITTTTTKLTEWQNVRDTIGEVNTVQGAVLSAEVAGRVKEILVKDGSDVKKGDVLVKLDDSVEKAAYDAGRTQANLNLKTYKRMKSLYERKAISTNEFEKAKLTYQSSNSNAESLKASWERKLIKAPFSGKAGVRRVNVGEYINQGQEIIPLHDLSNLYVEFDVPANEGVKLKVGDKVSFVAKEKKNENKTLKISAIDAAASGFAKTYKVRTNSFAAKDMTMLKPGQFVRLSYGVGKVDQKIVIPSTAINKSPYGDSVFIIKDGKANPSFIKTGNSRGDLTAVIDGLEENTEIATTGIFKIIPGGKVIINNENKMEPKLSPKPNNS